MGAVTIGCSIIGERPRVLPRSGYTPVILRAQRAAGIHTNGQVADNDMAGDEKTDDALIEIPPDSTVVRQSSWAWQLPTAPWAIFAVASIFVDAISFGVLPFFLLAIVAVPRYLRWKKAAYILTEDHVVVFRGGLAGRRRYDLPIDEFVTVDTRPGLFGGNLGYRAVHITLENGNTVVLDYLPEDAPLADHIESRIGRHGRRRDRPTEGE